MQHHCFIFFCIQLPVYGLNPDGFEQGMHVGHVFARAVVKDDNGHPLWAEYNAQGGYTRIAVSGQKAATARVMAGETVRGYLEQLQTLKNTYADLDILPIAEYNARLSQPFWPHSLKLSRICRYEKYK